VGHERSGTTLLAAIFDRHSRIAVPPETHFFTDLIPPNRAHETGDPIDMINHIWRGLRLRDLQLDPRELLARLNAPATWASLFLESLQLYAERRGKQWIGEKTPNHWRHAADLLRLFPQSRLLWMVRDGRDTVASLMKMPWRPHSNLAAHALSWRHAAERMQACQRQFPDRILQVRFEDLVTDQEAQVRLACDFIGIDFEPQQLDPAAPTGVVPDWEQPWKCRVFSSPDPSRIGVARRELGDDSLQLLQTLLGPTLFTLGYDVDESNKTALAMMAA
ncbi:MAG TPA: sulfotransferase, partial [Tepidisphaeraceae bacterium]|nr:sulfotransferase [Tepidisphaeraceae bacterium]